MPTFEFKTEDGRTFQLDAPDQNAAFKAFETVKNNVPVGGYVGQTLKGAAQSVAGTVDTGFNLTEAMGPAAYGNPITAPAAGLAAVMPSDWRKALTEFSNAPYTPGYETAGRIGYVGTELAPVGLGAKAAASGVKTGVKALKGASPVVKGLAKDAVTGLGGELAIEHFLGHLPFGTGALASIVGRHLLRKAMEKGGKKTAEEAVEAAPKAAGKGAPAVTKNESGLRASPGWTPEQEAALRKTDIKPRVRVQAPSRPARDDIND